MPDLPDLPSLPPPRRPLALRMVGGFLLFWSVGLVSCQALFVL